MRTPPKLKEVEFQSIEQKFKCSIVGKVIGF